MATKPAEVPCPGPELLPHRERPHAFAVWGPPKRVALLLLILLAVAYIANRLDDSYLAVDHPQIVMPPQGASGRSSGMYANALAAIMSPGAEKDSSSLDIVGDGQNSQKPKAGGLLNGARQGAGASSGNSISAAFGDAPY